MSSVDFAEKAFLDGKSIPLETTTPLPDLVITEKLGYNQSRRASSAFHSDVFKGPDMSPLRKWSILGIFCLSVFIDSECKRGDHKSLKLIFSFPVLLGSAFFVFTGIVARDLEILVEQQSWIISAYSCTFAICLLLMGRIVDLYNPRMVFCVGFLVVGIINLALSFVVEKYSFFVLRALAGVSCAAVVPSAYRMIPVIFPPEQRHRAYTLYGMTGSIANTTGTVIAGVFGLINASGSSGASQMSSWKWFLRLVGVVT
jgi:MFS family permease